VEWKENFQKKWNPTETQGKPNLKAQPWNGKEEGKKFKVWKPKGNPKPRKAN